LFMYWLAKGNSLPDEVFKVARKYFLEKSKLCCVTCET